MPYTDVIFRYIDDGLQLPNGEREIGEILGGRGVDLSWFGRGRKDTTRESRDHCEKFDGERLATAARQV